MILHRKLLPTLTVAVGLLSLACHGSQVRYQAQAAPPEPPDVTGTLYVVGDAGLDTPGRELVLAHLGSDLEQVSARDPARALVVTFLGDNIYDLHSGETADEDDLAQLSAQVAPVHEAPDARGVFVPGNHDRVGTEGDKAGVTAIETQEAWLQRIGEGRMTLMPDDGCPGPASVDVGPHLRLVLIDTEAILRWPLEGCGELEAFFGRLRDELARDPDQDVVLAAHHPLASGGPHGGNVGLLEKVPILYYLAKKAGLNVQDLASPKYTEMVEGLRSAIRASGADPLAFAAGHDHSLQVIAMNGSGVPRFQLVSGSASKSERARRVDGMRYATEAHGYMRLDVGASGVRLSVYAVDEAMEGVEEVFGCMLRDPRGPAACPEANVEDAP